MIKIGRKKILVTIFRLTFRKIDVLTTMTYLYLSNKCKSLFNKNNAIKNQQTKKQTIKLSNYNNLSI